MLTTMPGYTIQAQNFRVLDHLEWSPGGVCLLCGPNGSGKSTVLDALWFLRTLFERGHESALAAVGGQYFRKLDAPEDEPVEFTLTVGDIVWKLRFPMSIAGLRGSFGEELYRGGELVLRAGMFDEGWYLGTERHARDEVRCCARVLWDRGESEWMQPLANLLSGIRVYKSYWLNQVQRQEQTAARDSYLERSGRNLWSVLANWKASPRHYHDQFEWVMSAAREAFPELIATVEFDRGLPYIYAPGATEAEQGLPPIRAAEGLLTGLLHLTAVAGAKPGSILAFDEMENQLHPHAIRSLLSAMRRSAGERDLTIVLTTHSPVVLNSFRDEPEQVYVLDRTCKTVPTPMTELHTEDWLAQAKLGTLYERLAFAAPRIDGTEP